MVCPACHARLWCEVTSVPGVLFVPHGTLNLTTTFVPVAHLWTPHAQRWFVVRDGATQYKTQPDKPLELVRLWQQRQQTFPRKRTFIYARKSFRKT